MSTEGKAAKSPLTPFISSSEPMAQVSQRRWYDQLCVHCELPIGESQFSIGLRSARSLHLDCYLAIYSARPAASSESAA